MLWILLHKVAEQVLICDVNRNAQTAQIAQNAILG